MNQTQTTKSDVLKEASGILAAPGRDTKRKILIAVNSVFILALLLHLSIQLINFGVLPDPARDMIFYPILILINTSSLIYNLRVLLEKTKQSIRKDKLTAWFSIVSAMLLAILIVHTNPNIAVSMLLDYGFSVVLLFITGIVLGRRTAIIWFIISALSLYLAYQNVGPTFEYHFLSTEEITEYKTALENGVPEALTREQQLESENLKPYSSTLYANIWFIFLIIAFLAVYFESNMISRVLGVIPVVIDKINIASQQKNLLEKENMRMGMELDVARKIQMMMLPKDAEFLQTKSMQIAARMDPASEVGGDFYEFLYQKDGSVIVAMGDVTDHGLQSGLVMLMAQSIIRTIVDDQVVDLRDAMNQANKILYRNIHDRMNDHRNLTLALAKIEDDRLTLCGQHENLGYYNINTKESKLISTEDLGIYVGLIEDISEHVDQKTFDFNPGDVFFFYTDGLTEAENPSGELYGEERMMEVFTKNAEFPVQHIIDEIYKDVYLFIESSIILDDITVMIIKKN